MSKKPSFKFYFPKMISRRCLKLEILANFTITFGMLLQLLINENSVDYESIELKMNELDYATLQ